MRKTVQISLFLLLINFLSAVDLKETDLADSLLTGDSLEVEVVTYDSLFYNADSVYTNVDDNRISLLGEALIRYQSSRIKSDTITVSLDDKLAYSLGKSWLQDRDQLLMGEDIFFHFDKKLGFLSNGASSFDKGYYYGNEIRKISDKIYDIDNGRFTTCNAEEPHFYIRTLKLRFYQGDKIVAKPIIFEVNHFPVFALPFGTFSIKSGRESGILVPSPGYNSTKGKYIENIAYYLAYKNYADATLALDYYERTGWEVNLNSRYTKRYNYDGDVDLRYQHNVTSPQSSNNEWYFHSKHHSDFTNKTTFDSNLEFISSTRIFEGSDNIDERLNEEMSSSLAYKRPWLGTTLYMNASYKDDLKNETKDLTLPKVSFSISPKPLYEILSQDNQKDDEVKWWHDISLSYSFLGTHVGDINDPDPTLEEIFYKTKQDSTGEYLIQHNSGLKHYGKISYNHKIRGWLSLSQSLTLNEMWFDKDKDGIGFTRGNDYRASTGINFSLYGIRKFDNLFLKAFRHIITPNLSFTYKPDFTDNEKFYSFGGLNLNKSGKQRSINFSLTNKWSMKLRGETPETDKKIDDFLKISSSTSYDFEKEGKRFRDLTHSINIKTSSFKTGLLNISSTPSGNIKQDIYDISLKEKDWGISYWSFNLSNKIGFSGNASYVKYFPQRTIDFSEASFFQPDTLSLDEEKILTTIDELENLEKESKNWSLSFTHSYRTNKTSYENNLYTSELRTALNAKITRNWSVSYDNYIDLKDEELVSHNFTITRDLHCWKIVFKYTKQGDYWNYKFQLFNIELPDALKFKTSDHN